MGDLLQSVVADLLPYQLRLPTRDYTKRKKRGDMSGRFVSIWFHHLKTDWFSIRQPNLRQQPVVLKASSHGRMVITAANTLAEREGISRGMVLADARAMVPDLQVLDDIPGLHEKLL